MAGGIKRECENCNNQVEVKKYVYYCKFGEATYKECQVDCTVDHFELFEGL